MSMMRLVSKDFFKDVWTAIGKKRSVDFAGRKFSDSQNSVRDVRV